jgi:hypothetical protein
MRGCYEPTLEEFFADRAVQQLMASDGVSEEALRALLGALRRPPEKTGRCTALREAACCA